MIQSDKIHLCRVISSGLTGTTIMTFFSYLVSETKNKNFKEPELLGKLLYRLIPQINKKYSTIAGWNIHYTVGFLFASVYAELWKEKRRGASLESGLLMGGLSGLLAVIVWKLSFKLHPAPPRISFRKYYGHLLITHFVFGAFASIGFNMIRLKDFKK